LRAGRSGYGNADTARLEKIAALRRLNQPEALEHMDGIAAVIDIAIPGKQHPLIEVNNRGAGTRI
jgi:hypothetical protein